MRGSIKCFAMELKESLKELVFNKSELKQKVFRATKDTFEMFRTETRELIERLIDMKGALLEKQNDEKILQFGAKKTAKSVKTGGVKINISKKG